MNKQVAYKIDHTCEVSRADRTASPKRSHIVLALILAQGLFGANYLFSKMLVSQIPPLFWAGLRSVTAGTFMLVLLKLFGFPLELRRFFSIQWWGMALLGVCLAQGLFLFGLSFTTSSHSSLLATTIPIFTYCLSIFLRRESYRRTQAFGLLCSFMGMLVLLSVRDLSLPPKGWLGDTLTLLACLAISTFLIVAEKFFRRHEPILSTSWFLLLGGLELLFVSLLIQPAPGLHQLTTPTLMIMAASTFLGTLIPYVTNHWVLKYANSSEVALYAYLQPLVASVLGIWILGEVASPTLGLSALLILFGVLIVSWRKPAKKH